MRRLLIITSVVISAACFPNAPATAPNPPVVAVDGILIIVTPPIVGVHFTAGPVQCDTDGLGTAYCQPVPITVASVSVIVPDGYVPQASQAISLIAGQNLTLTITLTPVIPPLPAPPTRDQALNVNLTFQGLTVTTQQYGTLPWFEAALVSLNATDRQAVYAAKHLAGDTHCIVAFEWSYTESGQPYAAIPGADFTSHPQDFTPIVEEVIRAGFVPMVFLNEVEAESQKELPIVIAALKANPDGDLTPYVILVPGWDGVFYGWPPADIQAYGVAFRNLLPNGYLGLEHNSGHIPLGNGPTDWTLNGAMSTYDLLLSEFDLPAGDTLWQIAARTLGPAYHRPADQPAADDTNPPFYLAPGTPRGRQYACGFEDYEYQWVRGGVTAAQIVAWRAYKRAAGYSCIG